MGSETSGRIEALEHQLMRAWATGDRKVLRALLSRRFRMVVAAGTPVLLDRKSMLEAAGERWRLERYRFGQAVYSREAEGVAVFAAELEMEGAIEGRSVEGRWWQVDVWKKGGLSRKWKLLDRQLARIDGEHQFPQAVRSLQLWR